MKAKLPGGPRYMITSLAVLARAGFSQPNLLPTPGAWLGRRPENSMADPERMASREHTEGRRGDRSLELPDALAQEVKLLPTPVVTDSFGSRRSTARTDEWESNPGTTLTDAIWETQGRTMDTRGKLLPTPTGDDANNNGGPSQHERNSLPLNTVAKIASRGEATPLPSSSGSESSDDPPHSQLTLGDA